MDLFELVQRDTSVKRVASTHARQSHALNGMMKFYDQNRESAPDVSC